MTPELTLKLAQRVMPESEWYLHHDDVKAKKAYRYYFSPETSAEHLLLTEDWLMGQLWSFNANHTKEGVRYYEARHAISDVIIERDSLRGVIEKAAEIELEIER